MDKRSIANWLNKDPLGERGGLNLYAYVLNDPINGIDLYGFEYQFSVGIGGVIGGSPLLVGGLFGGGGVNIGFNTSGQVFIQFQATGMVGFGLFGGVGLQAGIGHTDCPTKAGISTDKAVHGEANAGWGEAVGVSGDLNSGSQSGGFPAPGLDIGVGGGAMVGVGASTTTTIAVPISTLVQAAGQANESYPAGWW